MKRLKAAESVFDFDYTYDALGNRTQQTENTVTTSYTFNNMMRLTAKTVAGQATDFTYDLNGNMTEKEEGNSSYTYTWDINNRFREVREDDSLLFEYLYDSHGRRVMSHNHSTGVTTTYIYAGINVIYEATSSESTDYLYANGMRIAKKTGSTVKYFHPDHLGSTRLVTDSSGQPTFESDYKPFGEEANATGTEKYAFTGQYSEADIGLYYFGARWYDASLGRFISEDPLKGSMTISQSQNPYVYCMNNPLRYVDPSGMNELLPDDPYQTYGHLSAAELVYGIREDPSIFDDIIDDYNTWYDYWHGDGSSGHDYPDQNLYKEAEREVDGLRRFSGSGSVLVFGGTLEYLHDLHKDSINERAFRITLGSCTTVSRGLGATGSVGTVNEESIDNYLNNDGWVSAGGTYYAGMNFFFNSENEYYGQEAVFGFSGGLNYNTPDDLVLAQYYEGQFTSDIPVVEHYGNVLLNLFGVI